MASWSIRHWLVFLQTSFGRHHGEFIATESQLLSDEYMGGQGSTLANALGSLESLELNTLGSR
jgi:hypothetical protein